MLATQFKDPYNYFSCSSSSIPTLGTVMHLAVGNQHLPDRTKPNLTFLPHIRTYTTYLTYLPDLPDLPIITSGSGHITSRPVGQTETDRGIPEQTRTDHGRPGYTRTDQGILEQTRVYQGRPGQTSADQDKPKGSGQIRTDQDRPGQTRTDQDRSG